MSVIAMMLLFVLLQPGMFLTLPAVGRSIFMSGKMSVQAVFVHALVFAVVLHVLRRGGYFEGFAGPLGQAYPNAALWTAEGFASSASPATIAQIDKYIAEINGPVTPKTPPRLAQIRTLANQQLIKLRNLINTIKAKSASNPLSAKELDLYNTYTLDFAQYQTLIALIDNKMKDIMTNGIPSASAVKAVPGMMASSSAAKVAPSMLQTVQGIFKTEPSQVPMMASSAARIAPEPTKFMTSGMPMPASMMASSSATKVAPSMLQTVQGIFKTEPSQVPMMASSAAKVAPIISSTVAKPASMVSSSATKPTSLLSSMFQAAPVASMASSAKPSYVMSGMYPTMSMMSGPSMYPSYMYPSMSMMSGSMSGARMASSSMRK